jgi:protoheme IX farnesyltransferase
VTIARSAVGTPHVAARQGTTASSTARLARWRGYLQLTKPKVVSLIAFTSLAGSLLASPVPPRFKVLFWSTFGVALASGCAATINQVIDRRIDAQMARTCARPLPAGLLTQRNALVFAAVMGATAMLILGWLVNRLTAILTFSSLIGYAVIYTAWLKRATPQNIVIGGAAGAIPPLLGWVSVTNSIDPDALILFLIIFLWTPPHFWALAIARRDDYARAGIPMLPVVYGVEHTRRRMLQYTLLLAIVTLLPFLVRMSGIIYLLAAFVLNARFLCHALSLNSNGASASPMRVFKFSVTYLMWLFAALLIDHYLPTTQIQAT